MLTLSRRAFFKKKGKKRSNDDKEREKRSKKEEATSSGVRLLNRDLTLEVVRRCPARSIARFRAVSKDLRDGIADIPKEKLPPLFAGFVFQHGPSFAPLTAFVDRFSFRYGRHDHDDSISMQPDGWHIRQSSGGRLLCSRSLETGDEQFALFHPSQNLMCIVGLTSFVKMFHACFLAFDRVTSDYKIFCLLEEFALNTNHPYRLKVFAASTGQWRNVCTFPDSEFLRLFDYNVIGVHVGKEIYFIPGTKSNHVAIHIHAISVVSERLAIIEVPSSVANHSILTCLGANGGDLHLATLSHTSLRIWKIEGSLTHGDSEFTAVHDVSKGDLLSKIGSPSKHDVNLMHFHPDRKILVLQISSTNTIHYYNFAVGEFEEVTNNFGTKVHCCFSVFRCHAQSIPLSENLGYISS